MNANEIPARAVSWIASQRPFFETLAKEQTPAMYWLAFEELSDEYYGAFKRDLFTDLEALANEVKEQP